MAAQRGNTAKNIFLDADTHSMLLGINNFAASSAEYNFVLGNSSKISVITQNY
jgi:ATP-dependent phosphoenolpyruvate carboxykinase